MKDLRGKNEMEIQPTIQVKHLPLFNHSRTDDPSSCLESRSMTTCGGRMTHPIL